MERIPVAGPSITQKEIDYVTEAVREGWYEKFNYYQDKFERSFANYVGRKYAIALPSCTSALHLAFACLGLKKGDEVLVPESTWIATTAPLSYVGAEPVFVDINPKTWCVSVESLKAHLSPRTKAIILVDLYGGVPDMDPILEFARQHNLAIVEDAAQSLGTLYKGKKCGSFGDISVFSFHGTKILTTGEGGIFLTDRKDIYERCLFLRDHGRSSGPKIFWNDEVAFKYKMPVLSAALGLAQIERIEELVQMRRQIFHWYQKRLGKVAGLTLNFEAPETRNTFWMVTAVLDSKITFGKENLILALRERGIDSRPFFYPLSSMPAYAHSPQASSAAQKNPVSYDLSTRAINLPSGFHMTEAKVDRVCKTLLEVLDL